MQRITFPRTDLVVAPLGLGTGDFGAGLSVADAEQQMDMFLDLGGNLVDTAHIYNDWVPGPRGRSEIVIGNYMKKRGNRSRITLSTKGAHPRLDSMHEGRCRPEDIVSDLEASLTNLQTDRADIYFLHRDDPNIPIADILGCLEDQVRAGKIRYYGCSNWTLKRMKEMAEYAQQHGLSGFTVSQPMWSLADVNQAGISDDTLVPMDEAMYAYHMETGMAVMAYTSTAGGHFAKRAANKVTDRQKAQYGNASNTAIFEGLQQLAAETGLGITALSLLYFAAQPFAAVPLTSFSSQAQLTEAAAILALDQYPADALRALGQKKRFLYT